MLGPTPLINWIEKEPVIQTWTYFLAIETIKYVIFTLLLLEKKEPSANNRYNLQDEIIKKICVSTIKNF